jgi:hypothetical protein
MGVLISKTNSYRNLSKTGIFALLGLFLMVSILAPAFLGATANAADTEMMHTPPDYFVPDNRIQLTAQVEDSEGVKLVRCYFKAAGEADLVFVPMNTMGSDKYSGVLPAPSATTDQIEYLFLSVNNAKEVVRSQTFTMSKNAEEDLPAWQEIPKEGEIKVSMELDKIPTQLRGFSDNVTIDFVESGARFGVVALLYHNIRDSGSSGAGGTGSAASSTVAGATTSSTALASATTATGATSAGIITASAVGWSTAAIVGVGVGVAAVAGGTAAAVSGGGGGGGGDDDHDNNPGQGEDLTEKTILGFWNLTGSSTGGATLEGDFTFNTNETFSYDWVTTWSDNSTSESNGTGTWTLTGTNLVLNYDAGAIYNGTASGDSDAFTMVATNNSWTLNFKR